MRRDDRCVVLVDVVFATTQTWYEYVCQPQRTYTDPFDVGK